MTRARIFSEEELRIGALRSVDALREALGRRDVEAARLFANRLRREVLSMRQNYDGWEATLLGWLSREAGESIRDEAARAIDRDDESLLFAEAGQDVGERWRQAARQIQESIDRSEFDAALDQALELHRKALVYHDRGLARVAEALSFIGRHFGTFLFTARSREACTETQQR